MDWVRRAVSTSLLGYSLLAAFLFGPTPGAVAQAPGTFIPTGNMTTPRIFHTATLLLNGKVLIAGGDDFNNRQLASAELFDPMTNTFTPTGDMTTGRSGHSANLLPGGRVLIVGGQYHDQPSAELYDPSTGTFTTTAVFLPSGFGYQSTSLNNGKVLLSGDGIGCPNGNDGCFIINTSELYDPATGTVTVTGDYADKTGNPYFGDLGLIAAPAVLAA